MMTADSRRQTVAGYAPRDRSGADDPTRGRQRRAAERAKSLATNFARYCPPATMPAALAEASYLCDESHNAARPLLERFRILGLMATSLDQFCVDQTGIADLFDDDSADAFEQPSIYSPACYDAVSALLDRSAHLLRADLLPRLAEERRSLIRQPVTLTREQRVWLRAFFQFQIFPLLTPLAIDPGHPFPFISSYSLNFLVQLRGVKTGTGAAAPNYARIKVPRLLNRFVEAPPAEMGEGSERSFLWSEEIVRFFLPELFPGLSVENAYLFRVLRPIPALSDESELLDPQPVLHQRHLLSSVVRLDVEAAMPETMCIWLAQHLGVATNGVYRINGHMALFQLTDLINLIEGSEADRMSI